MAIPYATTELCAIARLMTHEAMPRAIQPSYGLVTEWATEMRSQ
jgi:hypothetical protein